MYLDVRQFDQKTMASDNGILFELKSSILSRRGAMVKCSDFQQLSALTFSRSPVRIRDLAKFLKTNPPPP